MKCQVSENRDDRERVNPEGSPSVEHLDPPRALVLALETGHEHERCVDEKHQHADAPKFRHGEHGPNVITEELRDMVANDTRDCDGTEQIQISDWQLCRHGCLRVGRTAPTLVQIDALHGIPRALATVSKVKL